MRMSLGHAIRVREVTNYGGLGSANINKILEQSSPMEILNMNALA